MSSKLWAIRKGRRQPDPKPTPKPAMRKSPYGSALLLTSLLGLAMSLPHRRDER